MNPSHSTSVRWLTMLAVTLILSAGTARAVLQGGGSGGGGSPSGTSGGGSPSGGAGQGANPSGGSKSSSPDAKPNDKPPAQAPNDHESGGGKAGAPNDGKPGAGKGPGKGKEGPPADRPAKATDAPSVKAGTNAKEKIDNALKSRQKDAEDASKKEKEAAEKAKNQKELIDGLERDKKKTCDDFMQNLDKSKKAEDELKAKTKEIEKNEPSLSDIGKPLLHEIPGVKEGITAGEIGKKAIDVTKDRIDNLGKNPAERERQRAQDARKDADQHEKRAKDWENAKQKSDEAIKNAHDAFEECQRAGQRYKDALDAAEKAKKESEKKRDAARNRASAITASVDHLVRLRDSIQRSIDQNPYGTSAASIAQMTDAALRESAPRMDQNFVVTARAPLPDWSRSSLLRYQMGRRLDLMLDGVGENAIEVSSLLRVSANFQSPTNEPVAFFAMPIRWSQGEPFCSFASATKPSATVRRDVARSYVPIVEAVDDIVCDHMSRHARTSSVARRPIDFGRRLLLRRGRGDADLSTPRPKLRIPETNGRSILGIHRDEELDVDLPVAALQDFLLIANAWERRPSDEALIAAVDSIVRRAPTENLTLDEFARLFGIDPTNPRVLESCSALVASVVFHELGHFNRQLRPACEAPLLGLDGKPSRAGFAFLAALEGRSTERGFDEYIESKLCGMEREADASAVEIVLAQAVADPDETRTVVSPQALTIALLWASRLEESARPADEAAPSPRTHPTGRARIANYLAALRSRSRSLDLPLSEEVFRQAGLEPSRALPLYGFQIDSNIFEH